MTRGNGKRECPDLEALGAQIRNPLFERLCRELITKYRCKPKIMYSSCSWEPGWNVKFQIAGRTLCTVYPREGHFVVMVVIGPKERERVEMLLPVFSPELQEIWTRTKEGNGQRWLMVNLEEDGPLYERLLQLIQIRRENYK